MALAVHMAKEGVGIFLPDHLVQRGAGERRFEGSVA